MSEELAPASVLHGLQSVAGLQAGRSGARQSSAVQPVDDDLVTATLPHLPPAVRDMVQIQRLVGCRPEEVRIIRRQTATSVSRAARAVPHGAVRQLQSTKAGQPMQEGVAVAIVSPIDIDFAGRTLFIDPLKMEAFATIETSLVANAYFRSRLRSSFRGQER